MPEQRRNCSFSLDPEVLAIIKASAALHHVSLSDELQNAAREYVERHPLALPDLTPQHCNDAEPASTEAVAAALEILD